MLLPKTVKVGTHSYSIKERPTSKMPGRDCLGHCDIGALTITIDESLPTSRKVEVLIHECLHAILQGTNLDNEELVVGLLGEALSLFIKQNPTLLRRISTSLRDA